MPSPFALIENVNVIYNLVYQSIIPFNSKPVITPLNILRIKQSSFTLQITANISK